MYHRHTINHLVFSLPEKTYIHEVIDTELAKLKREILQLLVHNYRKNEM